MVPVYKDGDKIIAEIGNDSPHSASVLLLDKDGLIDWLYIRGFSPQRVLELKQRAAVLSGKSAAKSLAGETGETK